MLIDGRPEVTHRCKSAIRVSILTGCLISPLLACAETQWCSNPNITVSAELAETREAVCTASELALNFLVRYGLQVKRPVRISVVEQPLQYRSYSAYGSYDSRSDLVQVMSPQAIHRATPAPQIYHQPLDQVHYQGIVAHEVAHALIQQNSQVSPQPVGQAAQEYLACVTQLSILPPENREQVIYSAGVGPWESGDVISSVYMAMAPDRFAVKSYLHFQQHPLPEKFVDELLRSKWFYVNVE
jgi:hypothetical protein